MSPNYQKINTNSPNKSIEPKAFGTPKASSSSRMKPFLFVFFLYSIIYNLSSVHALTSVNTSNPNLVKNGLVGYWTFDGKNMTNATATDSSGGGTNGTLTNMTGASSKTIGKIGQDLRFDGVDDYINLGTGTLGIPAGSTAMSISAWVKVSAYQSYGAIVGKGRADAPYGGWQLNTNGDSGGSKFDFALNISGVWSSSIINGAPGQNYATGKWYHVVGTYDGTTIKVYVNAVVDSSVAVPGTIQYAVGDSAANVLLGRNPGFSGANNHFNGIIDDVRIYNRALTAREIQSLYKAGGGVLAATPSGTGNSVGINSGLVGYWTFDGKNVTNATATDSSGSGNNGTLTNMTATSSKTAGKIGQALNFDGSTTYINGGSNSTLQLSLPLSFSYWVKQTSLDSINGHLGYRETGIHNGYYIYSGTTGALAINYGDNTACSSIGRRSKITSAGVFNAGKWVHIVGVIRGATDMSIYVNGVDVGGSYDGSGGPITYSGSSFLRLGGYGGGGGCPTTFLNGSLDDVRLYNRALSVAEVKSLYKAGGGVLAATSPGTSNAVGVNGGLVGYWTFDGKNMTNATATDSSINIYNGALVSMTARANATQGKIGQGLRFNGTTDYINIGAGKYAFTNTTPFSGSAWIKTTSTGNLTIMSNINLASSAGWYAQISSGGLRYFMTNSGLTSTINLLGPTAINDGKWHHITFTNDGSHTAAGIKLYVDGRSESPTVFSNSDPGALTDYALKVGVYDLVGTPFAFFSGSLDDVRVYNRVLSAKEVQSLYKLGAQ